MQPKISRLILCLSLCGLLLGERGSSAARSCQKPRPSVAFVEPKGGFAFRSTRGRRSSKFSGSEKRLLTAVDEEESIDETGVSAARGKVNGRKAGGGFPSTEGKTGRGEKSIQDALVSSLFSGIEPSPEIYAIMTVYFVQGALGIARLATNFFLKDELHLSPAEVSALTGVFFLPWYIKPLYGLMSDALPIGGYRRRSYLFLAGAVGCAAWLALSLLAKSVAVALVCNVAANLSLAVSDVVADGIVVEKTRRLQKEAEERGEEGGTASAGALQSLCWSANAAGGVTSAYFSGSLLETLSPQQVFSLTAAFPLLVSATSLIIQEDKVGGDREKEGREEEEEGQGGVVNGKEAAPKKETATEKQKAERMDLVESEIIATSLEGVVEKLKLLWSALKAKPVLYPTLFLVAWRATPSSDSAFFYFLSNQLNMQPEFFGRIRLVSALCSLLGVWVYNKYLKSLPVKEVLRWVTIVGVPLGLVQLLLVTGKNRELGIPDDWFALGEDGLFSVLGQIGFLPTLVIAAQMCPPGIEGTLFAALMSVSNLSGGISSELGALMTSALGVTEKDFTNLPLLIVLTNFLSLLPLPFIGLLDEIGSVDDQVAQIAMGQKGADEKGNGGVEGESMHSSSTVAGDVTEPTKGKFNPLHWWGHDRRAALSEGERGTAAPFSRPEKELKFPKGVGKNRKETVGASAGSEQGGKDSPR
uniref:Folate/biopterin transporter n=1 Tax=Chromera velia CCMP2878 TaxID=1169474 RepID=A0A0G4FN09_9ALVE|eukprot:Cvel_17766.t1-p1 / transcript=Cvel_17766.t1 / gene=Cvel_17766 / organism=Chromera_velia_CCMP2878 / gene_product=Folate-biopterin transporter 1, chloroplastic, putative / transcript_product=Folate-biopterin transporter 1, chloroplastic, putative / location=Cvel_scaffold1436:30104-32200(+) / protein_length=699 / sequence_SO=supercontig / SO=protein_coding / is_pseudo=false